MSSGTKKKAILFYPVFFSFLLFISCNMKFPDNHTQTENLQFQFKPELLSTSPLSTSEGLSFYIPRDWETLPLEKENLLKSTIETAEDTPALIFLKAYQSINLSTLIITKVNSLKENFSFLSLEYYSQLQSQFNSEDIHQAEFSVNSLPMKQFIIQTDSHIIIILYVGGKQNYQLKFIVPKIEYEQEIGKIESSIGTITNTGEKR